MTSSGQEKTRRNVLVVGVDQDTFDAVAPVLGREAFDVDRFPSAEGALELLALVPFDVILVGFPLDGMVNGDFLDRIRGRVGESACVRSAVVLLAESQDLEKAEKLVGAGANRVLVRGREHGELQNAVAGLLGVAQRVSVRIMARVEVAVATGHTAVLCQTENVSQTGMLLRTDRQLALGSKVGFEFLPPGLADPIRGKAQVVRHASLGREGVMGVGLRFLEVSSADQRRLDAFVGSTVGVGAA